jgi:hypothetical protein
MPKRVLDGDGLWRSDKLAQVEPAVRRAEYANLLPLALANGVFESNPRRIWASVYSYNRPDVSLHDVEAMLDEFERVKLLFRWSDALSQKVWGFWIGIDKPGRLPGRSRRGTNELVGPEPPTDELRKFLESNGIQNLPDGNKKLLGFGSCLGLGSGTDSVGIHEKPAKKIDPSKSNATSVAQALCSSNGWSGKNMLWALQDAIEFQAKRMPESALEQVGEALVKAYFAHKSAKGTFAVGPQKFFEQGLYCSGADRAEAKSNVMKDNPATRALAQMEAS